MNDDSDRFVMVLDDAEVRRHVPAWPEGVLLGAAIRDGVTPEIRRLSETDVLKFAAGLPVVPHRQGAQTATPSMDAEIRVLTAALEVAPLLATEPPETANFSSDPFADVEEAAPEENPPPNFEIRRRGAGFELRMVGMEAFPWNMDRISIGASMFGASFVEQPLDRMLMLSVGVSDLGPMAPMASFLPKRWTSVVLADGPYGQYFDISPILLNEISKRMRRATLFSAAAVGLLGFFVAAAVVVAVWNSLGHPGI